MRVVPFRQTPQGACLFHGSGNKFGGNDAPSVRKPALGIVKGSVAIKPS